MQILHYLCIVVLSFGGASGRLARGMQNTEGLCFCVAASGEVSPRQITAKDAFSQMRTRAHLGGLEILRREEEEEELSFARDVLSLTCASQCADKLCILWGFGEKIHIYLAKQGML